MSRRIKKIFQISIIKTLRMNFRYFSWKGLVHPYIFVARKVLLSKLDGTIEFRGDKRIGCVRIGFPHVSIFDAKYERSIWDNDGKVVFCGDVALGQGTRICNHGELVFGDRMLITANCSIICYTRIVFGRETTISWDVLIMDCDLHSIKDKATDKSINPPLPISIGNHTWICCRTLILKGTQLEDNTIVAAGSVISGSITEKDVIVGTNKKIIKENVQWDRAFDFPGGVLSKINCITERYIFESISLISGLLSDHIIIFDLALMIHFV